MKISLEEAKDLLLINRQDLDIEVQRQAQTYWQVAEQCAEAISIRDSLKEEKDKVWAEQFIVNKVEAKLDGKGVSDKVAETYTDASKIYSKANKEYLDAKLDADKWIGMKESWQQRAVMLRELCGLNASLNYGEMTIYQENKRKMRGK